MQETGTTFKPVGSMMRPVPRLWPSASVSSAAIEVRESGLPAVAVTEGSYYVGLVTQRSLADALARGVQPNDPVELAYDRQAKQLPPYAPSTRALELFASEGVTAIPIVDDYGVLMGVLTPADLWPKRDRPPHPPMVGGMATPFGVYLTTGWIRAGASNLALISTGVMMSALLVLAVVVGEGVAETVAGFHWKVPIDLAQTLTFLLFALSFRLLPLSGIHAAEHKVVHAVERGEELTIENVRRMPRVHPRCGTNFATGASIFLGIASLNLPIAREYQWIGALVATLLLWRPIGSLVQQYVTTKEPTDRQIDMGISSAKELLNRHATSGGGKRTIFNRIWNTGLLHVLAGMIVVFEIAQAVFHIPVGL